MALYPNVVFAPDRGVMNRTNQVTAASSYVNQLLEQTQDRLQISHNLLSRSDLAIARFRYLCSNAGAERAITGQSSNSTVTILTMAH